MANLTQVAGLANMVRLGRIVSIDGEENTAVVSLNEISASSYGSGDTATTTFNSRAVQRICRVLNRGSKKIKDYFNYSVGEKVICVFPMRIAGGSLLAESVGYIAGSFFDDNNKPPCFFDMVQMIDFGVGSVEVDMEDKSLDIEFEGSISINGKEIYLNA